MKVFHGTSFRRYREIILRRSISVTTEEKTHYSLSSDKVTTKCGAVYLTDNHTAAVEFGLRCWLDDNHRCGYYEDQPEIAVFELDIDCDELYPDKEESEKTIIQQRLERLRVIIMQSMISIYPARVNEYRCLILNHIVIAVSI